MDSYGLSKKIIVYVKYEGVNFNSMTTALKFDFNCEVLGLEESFNDAYFYHAFSKTFQYVIVEKNYAKILSMSQSSLHSLISISV